MIYFMQTLIMIVWALDLMNLSFMEMLDTVYPINRWEWFIVLIISEWNIYRFEHTMKKAGFDG